MGDDGLAAAPADDDTLATRGGTAHGDEATVRRAFAPEADAALARPIRDLLPTSYRAIALAALAGLLPLGAIVVVHHWSARVRSFLGVADAGILDLAAPGNAGRWFAAMLMALAALVAMFIYALRRHRVDDYHGRYRVWIWTSIAALAVSFAEATNVVALLRELSDRAATAIGVSSTIAWPATLGAILSLAGIRLLVEIRRSRGAVVLWTLAAVMFLLAAATSHAWLIRVPQTYRLLLERGSWLAGYLATLGTFLLYARYVALQIEGKIAVVPAKLKPPKAKKKKQPRREAEETEHAVKEPGRKSSSTTRTDLDPVPAPEAEKPAASQNQSRVDRAEPAPSSGDGGQSGRPLSKKERRRMRRAARMQAQSS